MKRPNNHETNNCPIIPVLFLVNASTEAEANEQSAKSTGALKTINQSTPLKELLLALVEMLYNSRKVEDLFKDLKQSKVVAAKYPYLPIFNTKPAMAVKKKVAQDTESVFSASTTSSAMEYGVEEIEECEYSSILPEILQGMNRPESRKAPKEENSSSREPSSPSKIEKLNVSTSHHHSSTLTDKKYSRSDYHSDL